jgi:hypothetical protein
MSLDKQYVGKPGSEGPRTGTLGPPREYAAGTYKWVQEQLREVGIVISKRGETLRINYFSGLEDTAHYTTSLQEALETGFEMRKRGGRVAYT